MPKTHRMNSNRNKFIFAKKNQTRMNLNKNDNNNSLNNKNNNLYFGTINENILHSNKKMKNNKNKSSSTGDKNYHKKRSVNKSQ